MEERDRREKQRIEEERQQNFIRDQQHRETVQALQNLTSIVEVLVEEMKKKN